MKYLLAFLLLLLNHVSWSQSLINFRSGELWGYKDTKGKVKIPAKYKWPAEFHDHVALIMANATDILVVDTTGKTRSIIYNVEYSCIRCRHFFSNGLVAAFDTTNERYGFKNLDGEWVIAPHFYEVQDFQNGLAAVWENLNIYVDTLSDCGSPVTHSQWGYIDLKGNYVIPSKYPEPGKREKDKIILDFYGEIVTYDNNGKIVK